MGNTGGPGAGSLEGGRDPLHESWLIQEAASGLGFDWPDASGVIAKIREELGEIESALDEGDAAGAQRELGDVLFAAVNLSRFLGTDPGDELRRCNARFEQRFSLLREELKHMDIEIEKCSLAELDVVWERVKVQLERGT
jgi:ATP diphosphatase